MCQKVKPHIKLRGENMLTSSVTTTFRPRRRSKWQPMSKYQRFTLCPHMCYTSQWLALF